MNLKAKVIKFKTSLLTRGFNITEFSKFIEVDVSYTSLIVNGKRSPSPKLAKKMADALNVSIEDLFEVEIKTKEEI